MKTLFLLLLFSSQFSGWELLSTVKIERGYDDFMGSEVEKPIFSNQLLSREGTKIVLEGYVIPVDQDVNRGYFILSRFPYQSCFFCGGAGPETVVEVYAKGSFGYTDQRVRVEGTLKLNRSNSFNLFYILKDCDVEKLD